MNTRGDLADLIWEDAAADRVKDGTRASLVPVVRSKVEAMADKILAAGYRKPRDITTAEELDALGRGTAVLDAHQRVWTNDGDTLDQWGCVHHDEYPVSLVWRGSADVALPATVLHEGTQP